ncbi:putative Co/Zn/Cd efflux system membrane fusion protein [Acidisarcina polymorpha]|uniref:Putative Co/Zn/Cd efflux system membrane fusion protein n=1 Tax=Acidisarcina polymorpha TaxID=2211140 RepID=A0A2Z5G1E8_9BACT|nr:putative Co/Zn/Cd efflux system membrane fusion protein [Acidisarcina polymorpha]
MLLLFALAFYLVLRHHGDTAQKAAAGSRRGGFGPVTLTVATASKGSIGVYLDAIGTVTPVYTSSITAQAAGVVTAVHYHEGQLVHKGDSLIDIDPRTYQAQVVEAQGALDRDTNLLAQAKMDLARYQAAWARNAIPKQTLDDQEKLVLQDEGTVKNDEGTLQFNQVQLSYCHIVSPITGRVGLRLLDPGNVVTAGGTTVLVVITQVDPTTVIFTIPEDNLGQVQSQMRHGKSLLVDALDRNQQTKIASGKLMTIDNQIDTTTGTVKLRALFNNKTGALFANQFVNTKLLVNTIDGVTLIPTGAIQHNGQVSFVYAIENNTAKVKNVKPGVSDQGITAVQGIDPGTVVATSSFEKLQDGVKTVVSKEPIPANTTESNTP